MFLLFKNRPNDDDPVVFQIIDLYIYIYIVTPHVLNVLVNF